MDGDLWDWSYDQGFSFSDADESSSYGVGVESGWQADFYFGNGKDVIEENAMNEKCCVQVLKILIRKAAAEIDDLEEDLLLLQCDLAWTESRNQFDACCNALREKIEVLHNSIKSLRQSDKINTDDQLPLHRQPAEKLYEILKPFLGEGRELDGQEQHATVNSQSTDTSMQLVGPFCETSSISGMEVKSEEMEVRSILLAVDTITNGSVQKHKENDCIRHKEVKHATVNSQSTDTSMQLVGPFCKTSNISGMEVRSEEMEVKSILLAVDTVPNGSVQKHKEIDSICDKEIKLVGPFCETSSIYGMKVRSEGMEVESILLEVDTIPNGSVQKHKENDSMCDKEIKLVGPFCETSNIYGMKVRSEGMEVESILLEVDTIPNGSVQKHKENDSICDKEIKPEIAVDGVCSNALVTEENGCLKPDNLKSVSKVNIEEAKEQHINNNSCKSRKLKSASNIVGDCCLLKAQKHGKSVSEKANPEVPRQLDGFSGNKRMFDSNSSSPGHSNSGNCNTEEKLIDFLVRKKNKSDVGPILPESNGSASTCLSSITKGRVDSDLQVLETQKHGTFDTSYFRIMLLQKLQDQQGNDMVRTQTKETDIEKGRSKETDNLLLEDSQNFENVSHEKSHLNVNHMLKEFTEKGRSKSHTSISKAKKHRKQGAIGDNACLDLPLDRNPRVKSVEPCQLKAEMEDGALDAEKNLGPLSQNKGTSKLLVGQEFIDLTFVDDISSSDQIKLDSGNGEDKQRVKSCATTDDHHIAEIFAHFTSDLKRNTLSLVDLRKMAKHFNCTKYHKLRKQMLIDMLVGHLEREGRQTNGEVMRHH